MFIGLIKNWQKSKKLSPESQTALLPEFLCIFRLKFIKNFHFSFFTTNANIGGVKSCRAQSGIGRGFDLTTSSFLTFQGWFLYVHPFISILVLVTVLDILPLAAQLSFSVGGLRHIDARPFNHVSNRAERGPQERQVQGGTVPIMRRTLSIAWSTWRERKRLHNEELSFRHWLPLCRATACSIDAIIFSVENVGEGYFKKKTLN